ncbi:endothelin-converting enzyme homolog [Physella acuta]|uniref:endothelin-converting enzyme homolog n=1 Tax=Physella acuta TaxID=109671 RepID=UPI0027DE6AB0|nr:endothelin-converting enzyme homolog [Physella acuta]XP_059149214.1 endothelin-converting enzyme homolog [Physella acuta]XP_059149215.1 endothelin-converting enzyme homolog [Physella acuta]
MADEFKSFDKTPIINLINLNRWKFGLREIILGAIALLLLFLCVILASLFGKANNELSELAATQSQAYIDERMCVDIGCMETATRAMELRNKSVDPCENFYEYACGNYQNVASVYLDGGTRSVLQDLRRQNEDRLIDLMETPISKMHDASSERKLKQYFQGCNNLYTRDKKRGRPLLELINSELGGWKLLGNWKQDWDFNDALKKVQSEFWVEAFYSLHVGRDWYDHTKRAIEISPAGTGKYMYWSWYTNPNAESYRDAYKKFIRRVGSLLVNDAITMNITQDNGTTESDLDEFVNDTFTIESHLASVASESEYTYDAYQDANKVTLTELTSESNNLINWVQQLSYLFSTARITGATKVVLTRRNYIRELTELIASLPAEHRSRMLHNYLIWRLVERYVTEMSWDYIHANKEVYVLLHKVENFQGLYKYCFLTAQWHMQDALSALYVRHFFSEENKMAVHEITDNIKLALQSQLEKTPWMDATTKQYAKEKLDNILFKMGYPDWMGNQANVDEMYNGLTINASDHFANLLSINQYYRSLMIEELTRVGEDREEWYDPTYSTVLYLYWPWNELSAPAGILQYPIYSKKQPHHATFGSLGTILGRTLHHVVDEWGKWHDKNGDYMDEYGTWWSNASLTAYETVRKCVSDVYSNVTKTYTYPDGTSVNAQLNVQWYTPMAIAWTNGIRLALIGYQDWVKGQGIVEKVLPGTGLTNEQMIFLAHAQSYCVANDDRQKLNAWMRGQVANDIRVNMALGQLEEFSKAFNCKPEAKMNHKVKCDYY